MTGGWGAPRANPNRTQVTEAVQRIAAFENERPDVMTGRCADGLHEDCHGHILGIPCSCECHTACAHDFTPRWEGDDPARWTCAICLAPRGATTTEETTDDR